MELEEMKAQLSNCEIHFYCDVNALREQERADDNDGDIIYEVDNFDTVELDI